MNERTYDPNLDDVYVARDGTIRWDGEDIGVVSRTDATARDLAWRAEIGKPGVDERKLSWPRYAVAYARTRKAAVAEVLSGVVAPR